MSPLLDSGSESGIATSADPSRSDTRPLVLHVRSIAGNGGGPEKTILNSPCHLDQLGYRSYCAFLHRPEELAALQARAQQAETPLISVPDQGMWDVRVISRAIRICRRLRPVVWHAHEYKSNLLGLVVRRFWPMKLVTTVHGWVSRDPRHQLYAKCDRRFIRYYDAVIAVSDDIYQQCLRAGVYPERCCMIPNAIDLDEFRRKRPPLEARQTFPFPSRGFLIGAMGRLAEEKGFEVLIRAAAELLKQGHDLTVWIAGEGHLQSELQSLIDDLGCRERVFLIGHVNPPHRFFESLDLFVLSSYREGLPNVVLEAMAMKVPVVATTVAGIPSLICDGHNGVLIAPGSLDHLRDGIRSMMQDPTARSEIGHRARETLAESFSFSERMRRVVDVYRSL